MGKSQSRALKHLHYVEKPSTVDMSTSTGSLLSSRTSDRVRSEPSLHLMLKSQETIKPSTPTDPLNSLEDQKVPIEMNESSTTTPPEISIKTVQATSHLVKAEDSVQVKLVKSRSAPSIQTIGDLSYRPPTSYLKKTYLLPTKPPPSKTDTSEVKEDLLPKPPQKLQVFNLEIQSQEMGDCFSSEDQKKKDENNNNILLNVKLTESQADTDCMLHVASSNKDTREINKHYFQPERPFQSNSSQIQKMPQFITARAEITNTNKFSSPATPKSALRVASSRVASSTSTGSKGKKKLVVRGLKNFLSSRNAGYPPSWVRDFPCKSRFHPDNFLYDWDEGPSAVRNPQDNLTKQINACPKKGGRCDSCGLYNEDACRCCKKCPWDCDCPKPPENLPDVMGQAFGSGWNQAKKVICELTRDEMRAPVGGSPAKRSTRIIKKEFHDPFENSINVMRPNETEVVPSACNPLTNSHPIQQHNFPQQPTTSGYFNPYSCGYSYGSPQPSFPPMFPTYFPQPQMFPYAPPMMPAYQSPPQVTYPYPNSYNSSNQTS